MNLKRFVPTTISKSKIKIHWSLTAVTALGGGSLAIAALLHQQAEKPQPVAAPAGVVAMEPMVEVGPSQNTPGREVVEIESPTEVEVVKLSIALPHEDKETDFAAQAEEKLEAGQVREAFESLRKHIYTQAPTAERLHQIGRLGRELAEYAVAEQALLDAGALDPQSSEIQVELARVLLEAGDLEEARLFARQAIRLDKDNAAAWNLAGRIATSQSVWQRAEMSFRRAVELDPTNPIIHNNLGLLYIHMKRGEAAVASLETAVELYESDVPYFTFNNLGLAAEMNRDFEGAKDAFEQALVANPTYSRASVNLERVLTTMANLEDAKSFSTAENTPEPAEALEAEIQGEDRL